ncbi:MOSC domain-containing protein [Paenibacillus rhizophilus]|uniref:MOSC domain-containing protein n=1 Tax=Paenibacillus rhizophilus TaxID=1850366 RepID=A0A3N9P4K5_9BACL|nr:MOSC domain-containing protein [Paenibacillus rhizophilus]RQW10320.1 MOSC domain-containing protein [Paenibacillus rhizophilus]
MKIMSLNVGMPVTALYHGKTLETGIYKFPVEGPVRLSADGLTGDGQADLVNHGGPDKAVCVYPSEHYAYWEQWLGKKLDCAAFGENLATAGLLETEVCIGDIYEIGTALVQVSQPRYPCFKLSQKHGPAEFPAEVLKTGFSGFYFRVLREGELASGSAIVKVSSGDGGVPVSRVLHMMATGRGDKRGLEELVRLDSLASGIRSRFQGWLDGPE